MAEAFKDLANTLNSQTLDEAAKMEVAPFSHACTLVSPLFRCLGIAFKFAELDYVAKVIILDSQSNSIFDWGLLFVLINQFWSCDHIDYAWIVWKLVNITTTITLFVA